MRTAPDGVDIEESEVRATEKKKLRDALEQKRREVDESYRRSQTVNREATAEPLQDLADQATEAYSTVSATATGRPSCRSRKLFGGWMTARTRNALPAATRFPWLGSRQFHGLLCVSIARNSRN